MSHNTNDTDITVTGLLTEFLKRKKKEFHRVADVSTNGNGTLHINHKC